MSTLDFDSRTAGGLYLEDFRPGFRFVTGGVTFTESAIIDFALRYDPQFFHIDATAATSSVFGGLVASGFHTLSQGFRMVLDSGVLRAASMGSPGFDELRWVAPVRPGDTIHVECEVIESRCSESKPDRGVAKIRYCMLNQEDQPVLTMLATHFLRRTPTT